MCIENCIISCMHIFIAFLSYILFSKCLVLCGPHRSPDEQLWLAPRNVAYYDCFLFVFLSPQKDSGSQNKMRIATEIGRVRS